MGKREISRRDFVKITAAGAAAISLGGVLDGCASSTSSSSSASSTNAKDEVIVTMTVASEPDAGFDPFYAWGCGEHVHEPLLQSTLVTTDVNLNFVNDLATNYVCSDDRLSWTFDVRPDAKFTDGAPVTANDVAFTINGIKAFEGSQLDLTYVDEAVATSDTQVVIKLNKPFNALLYTLAVVGIVPAHAYDAKEYGANPIGSGRYMLEQWDKGQQVIFVANPDYYGEAPKIKKLTVLFVEEDTSLALAKVGKVDVAYTAATLADQVPFGYELFSAASVDCRGISLPSVAPGGTRSDSGVDYLTGNAVTCHEELRRAINYAVDREQLVKNTLAGHGDLCYSVCDDLPWGSDDMRLDTDVEKAAKFLTDAGWEKGTDGIYAKGGQRAAFDLYYPASDSVRQAMANEFANQMKAFGVEVNIKGSGWTTDPDGIYAHQFSDPVVWGWGANSPTQLYDLTFSAGASNYAVYQNDTVDAHLNAALATETVEESFSEWKKAQWDGTTGVAPQGASTWVWLANVDHLYFTKDGLKIAEQKPHPHGHGWSLVNNVDQWSW